MSIMIIELDFLIALARSDDKHHEEVLEILETHRRNLTISPYSLTELDLLVCSNTFRVEDQRRFFKLLNDTVNYYEIDVAKSSPAHIAEAYRLRANYRLTFFDSLHAAMSTTQGIPLLSYDRTYQRVKELEYVPPSKLT